LLGRHVLKGADQRTFGGKWIGKRGRRESDHQVVGAAGDAAAFCETEIENFCAGLGQHDVAGLEIAVNDAAAVGALEAIADVGADPR
jgi:hypothetical protein